MALRRGSGSVACLDTILLVDLIRRSPGLRERALRKIEELLECGELLVTTRLNMAELYVGVERSDDPDRERHVVETVLRGLGVLEFDERAARLFGRITALLPEIGRPATWTC
jgi:tRNA(fMet)-specific endonuclease VapC